MRVLLVAACLLTVVAVSAPSVTAMNEPVGGCGSDATVEYCQPVCITEPCNAYVCINHPRMEYCWNP